LLALVTLSGEGSGNQLYFLFYGLVAGSVLSGDGLRVAWVRRPALTRRTRRIAGLALAWLTVLVVLILVALHLRTASGVVQEGRVDLFLYGAFAASLVLLYLGAKRWGGPTRWAAAALVSVARLLVGALDTPINSLSALTSRPVPPSEGRRMTPQIYDALRWIRDKSSPDTVIAVNNRNQLEFNYAAFSERPVFLGGWAASQRSRDQGYAQVINGTINPFADRLRLNDAVFARGDRAALRVMTAQYRVRYLVIDKINGYPTDLRALTPAGVLVFRAPDVLVLRTS
jgi:hypothetical protein